MLNKTYKKINQDTISIKRIKKNVG